MTQKKDIVDYGAAKNSVWFQKYDREVNEKRSAGSQSKKLILIIIPIMVVGMLFMSLANGDGNVENIKDKLPGLIGVLVVLMLFVLLMIRKGKTIDPAQDTGMNLKELLKTKEEVDDFDSQMNAAPLAEIALDGQDTLFVTESFIGKRYQSLGDLKYSFIRRSDVRSLHFTKTAGTGANPMRASFFFDVRNGKNEVILNGTAETGKKMDQLQEILTDAVADLQIVKE